jgi:protein-arginine kinase activator protein McsA
MKTVHQETLDTLLEIDIDLFNKNPKKVLKEKRQQMNEAVAILDFETAAIIRDEIAVFEKNLKKKSKIQAK